MTPQEKRKQTLIKKYGSKEAYLEYMRNAGRKGGKVKVKKGFAVHPETARDIGKLGAKARWHSKASKQ